MKTKSDFKWLHWRQIGKVLLHWPVDVHSRHFEPIRVYKKRVSGGARDPVTMMALYKLPDQEDIQMYS